MTTARDEAMPLVKGQLITEATLTVEQWEDAGTHEWSYDPEHRDVIGFIHGESGVADVIVYLENSRIETSVDFDMACWGFSAL